MSWKLTKKLKETHLSPLASPFSRGASSSTVPSTAPSESTTPSSATSDVSAVSPASSFSAQSATSVSPASIAPNEAQPLQAQNGPPMSASEGAMSRATDDPSQATSVDAKMSGDTPRTMKQSQLTLRIFEAQGLSLSPEAQNTLQEYRTHQGDEPTIAHSRGAASFGSSLGAKYAGFTKSKTSTGYATGFEIFPTNHGRYSGEHLPFFVVSCSDNEWCNIVRPDYIDPKDKNWSADAIGGTPDHPYYPETTSITFDVSTAHEVFISIYIRNPFAPSGAESRKAGLLLGTCRFKPKYGANTSKGDNAQPVPNALDRPTDPSQVYEHAGTDWIPLQTGTGSLKISANFIEKETPAMTMGDYKIMKTIGEGSFGRVDLVYKEDTKRYYVVKSIRKKHIIDRNEVTHTLAERNVLAKINHPFIVPLKFAFQSQTKLFLVLGFVRGGELFYHLQQAGRFDLNRARFYTAELICALECLHSLDIIYRDLKPENILLDYAGHIVLCDFGLCKIDMREGDTTNTFCGTPEYLAPELLHGRGYDKVVDWWTLGVLLYEMLTGLPPYYDQNVNVMYQKILHDPLHFPSDKRIMPPAAQDLLTRLLDRRPEHRLGRHGPNEIKNHPFFHGIDWRKLLQRKYEPTFKPVLSNMLDTSNFDPEFTSRPIPESVADGSEISQTMNNNLFGGFSFAQSGLDAGSMLAGSSLNRAMGSLR